MAISDELRKLVDPNNECCCEHCLSNKCKEWASLYGYDLFSHRFDEHASYAYLDLDIKNVVPSNNKYIFIGNYIQEFEADTEAEAILLACQWVLDNKEN